MLKSKCLLRIVRAFSNKLPSMLPEWMLRAFWSILLYSQFSSMIELMWIEQMNVISIPEYIFSIWLRQERYNTIILNSHSAFATTIFSLYNNYFIWTNKLHPSTLIFKLESGYKQFSSQILICECLLECCWIE